MKTFFCVFCIFCIAAGLVPEQAGQVQKNRASKPAENNTGKQLREIRFITIQMSGLPKKLIFRIKVFVYFFS